MNTATQPDRQSDAALLARFARLRDEEAFAELMKRHGPMVLGVSLRMLHQRQDAEDTLQAVFLAVAAKARALRRVRSVAGWLHNVAVRISLNLLKMNRRREQGLRKLRNERTGAHKSETHSGAVRTDEPDELRAALDEELAQLPARFRQAVILRDLEGYSRHEAAGILGVPGGTVDSRLSRGRKLLRDRLVRRGVTVGAGGLAAMFAHCGANAPALGIELIHETYRNAQLFLAGTTAGKLSAATKIGSLAQGMLNSMFLTKLSTTVCIVALAAALVLGASPLSTLIGTRSDVRAQSMGFFDDFEDGNATDGSPATWSPVPGFAQTSFSVVNGDLRVTALQIRSTGILSVLDEPLGDTSIRAQVRLEGTGGQAAAVLARGDVTTLRSHSLEIAADGGLWLGIASQFESISTDLRPTNEDVMLQLDVIGDTIRGWAWRAGEPMPATPAYTRQSNALSVGTPGVYYTFALPPEPEQTPGTAIYRYVHVARSPIPEPSSVALGSLGLVALAAFGVRTRLARVRQPRT